MPSVMLNPCHHDDWMTDDDDNYQFEWLIIVILLLCHFIQKNSARPEDQSRKNALTGALTNEKEAILHCPIYADIRKIGSGAGADHHHHNTMAFLFNNNKPSPSHRKRASEHHIDNMTSILKCKTPEEAGELCPALAAFPHLKY